MSYLKRLMLSLVGTTILVYFIIGLQACDTSDPCINTGHYCGYSDECCSIGAECVDNTCCYAPGAEFPDSGNDVQCCGGYSQGDRCCSGYGDECTENSHCCGTGVNCIDDHCGCPEGCRFIRTGNPTEGTLSNSCHCGDITVDVPVEPDPDEPVEVPDEECSQLPLRSCGDGLQSRPASGIGSRSCCAEGDNIYFVAVTATDITGGGICNVRVVCADNSSTAKVCAENWAVPGDAPRRSIVFDNWEDANEECW